MERKEQTARAHIRRAFRVYGQANTRMRVFGWESSDKSFNKAIEKVFETMLRDGEVAEKVDGSGTYYTLN